MKKLMIAAVLCGLAYSAYAQGLPRLAVVALTTNVTSAKVQADAVTIRNLVESRMVASGKYQVISRDEIDKLLENQRIQVSSISSKENLTKLQLQNISYIVTGSVNAADSDYLVTVKILDVSSGQFSHSADEFMGGSSREMVSGVSALVSKFIAGMGSEEGRVVQVSPSKGGGGKKYMIGDVGPGGGIVFFIKGDAFFEVSGLLGNYTWEGAIDAAEDFRGGGFSDWYLPSKEELDFIYKNLQKANLHNFGNGYYWSSTSVWAQRFSDGVQHNLDKNVFNSVRAIRTF